MADPRDNKRAWRRTSISPPGDRWLVRVHRGRRRGPIRRSALQDALLLLIPVLLGDVLAVIILAPGWAWEAKAAAGMISLFAIGALVVLIEEPEDARAAEEGAEQVTHSAGDLDPLLKERDEIEESGKKEHHLGGDNAGE